MSDEDVAVQEVPADQAKREDGRTLRCSFCGKSKDLVRKFISGPGVYICNECVNLCNTILDADARDEEDDLPEPYQSLKQRTKDLEAVLMFAEYYLNRAGPDALGVHRIVCAAMKGNGTTLPAGLRSPNGDDNG